MNKLTVKIYPDGRVEAKFDAIDPRQRARWTGRLEELCAACAVDQAIKPAGTKLLAPPVPARRRPERT